MDFPIVFAGLKELLPIMAAAKVSEFCCGELRISFLGGQSKLDEVVSPPPLRAATPFAGAIKTEKVEDVVAPQTLDEEIGYDKILFHSSPDLELDEVPAPSPLTPESSDV